MDKGTGQVEQADKECLCAGKLATGDAIQGKCTKTKPDGLGKQESEWVRNEPVQRREEEECQLHVITKIAVGVNSQPKPLAMAGEVGDLIVDSEIEGIILEVAEFPDADAGKYGNINKDTDVEYLFRVIFYPISDFFEF